MAVIMFTEEEVRSMLPAQRKLVDRGDGESDWVRDETKISTPRAWEMFSGEGKYIDGDEAAQYVGDRLVELLTNGVKFDPTDEYFAEELADTVNSMIYGELNKKFGTGFGFSDTEPRYHMTVFFRKLLGDRS